MAKLRTVDNEEDPLARNLAAAFIATCHGIGLDYARKKYAGEPVGEYWIALARKVNADLSKSPLEPQRTLPFSDDGNGGRAGAVREERAPQFAGASHPDRDAPNGMRRQPAS